MKHYYHRFTVEGTGPFPHDMLRYDACWPSTSEDASTITFEEDGMRRRIRLTTIGHKDRVPTINRWLSFGWNVIHSEKGTEVG
jgi:hypothetical protein